MAFFGLGCFDTGNPIAKPSIQNASRWNKLFVGTLMDVILTVFKAKNKSNLATNRHIHQFITFSAK